MTICPMFEYTLWMYEGFKVLTSLFILCKLVQVVPREDINTLLIHS